MPSSNLSRDLDTDKLAETALALLSLTLHDHGRVWKNLDWDVLDLLHEKGLARGGSKQSEVGRPDRGR